MKRFVSLVLTAVVVCTLLSVFVLPASAETAEEMAEDYMTAGANLEGEGRHEDAAESYIKAAKLYEDADDPDSAATAYFNAGEAFAKVAELYRGAGNAVAAADAYMKAGECYEKAGVFSDAIFVFGSAAGLYNNANDYVSVVIAHAKTGECYEKANDLSHAKTAFGHAETALQIKLKELQDGFAASILSGGSLIILVGVAAFVLGLGAAFVVMCVVRKRRNKDDS